MPDYVPSDAAVELVAKRRFQGDHPLAKWELAPNQDGYRSQARHDLTAAVPLELQRERERWEQALNFCLGSMGEYGEGSPEYTAYKNAHTFIARLAAALPTEEENA